MAKKSTTKKAAKKKSTAELNETGRRSSATKSDRRKSDVPVANDRRKGHRRRQIDPTTCEREYSEQEIQFMHAMDEYKNLSGRMFPTCSEILEVLQKLGYRQVAEVQEIYNPNADAEKAQTEEEIEDESEVLQ